MNELKALSEEKVNYGQTRGVTYSEMGGRLLQEFCVKKVQLFEKRIIECIKNDDYVDSVPLEHGYLTSQGILFQQ